MKRCPYRTKDLVAIFIIASAIFSGCQKPERVPFIRTLDMADEDIGAETVTLRGDLVDAGSDAISDLGMEVKSSSASEYSKLSSGQSAQAGEFSVDMSDPYLIPGTSYEFRAYIKTSKEVIYGELKTFESRTVNLPTIKTNNLGDISSTGVLAGGDITDNGGANITERGVCWSTSQEPTISNDHLAHITNGTGHFDIEITGLTPLTEYYVRAYATNFTGTSYGNQETFVTEGTPPTLTTNEIGNITSTGASSGGDNISENGSSLLEKGICWSSSKTDPDLGDNSIADPATTADGFALEITNLDPKTRYYVRAYATNEHGTGYGNTVEFTTHLEINTGTFTDSRDGTEYNWTIIGTQKWMAQNLAYLPEVSPAADASLTGARYYVYGYNATDVPTARSTTNFQSYGVLYNWKAAMAGAESNNDNPGLIQGVCPDGWHLPSDADWQEMEIFLELTTTEADQTGPRGSNLGTWLKESGLQHWSPTNDYADNQSYFSALPGGRLYFDHTFTDLEATGFWWSSTQGSDNFSYMRSLNYASPSLSRYSNRIDEAYSVRCIEGSGIKLPEIETDPPTSISYDGASAGGNVVSDGGSSITERGICWSTTQGPTTNDGTQPSPGTTGTFSVELAGLSESTTYYYRAYATNAAGTSYGAEYSFTTDTAPVSDI